MRTWRRAFRTLLNLATRQKQLNTLALQISNPSRSAHGSAADFAGSDPSQAGAECRLVPAVDRPTWCASPCNRGQAALSGASFASWQPREVAKRRVLLPGGPLIQALLRQQHGDVIHVQAVAHAGVVVGLLNDCDIAVAVIVAWRCAVQHAEGDDLAAFQLYDFVAILCLAAVAIVHVDYLNYWLGAVEMEKATEMVAFWKPQRYLRNVRVYRRAKTNRWICSRITVIGEAQSQYYERSECVINSVTYRNLNLQPPTTKN